MPFSIEVITSIDSLPSLEKEWRAMEADYELRFYQRYHYYLAAFRYLMADDATLHVYAVRKNNELVAVLPWQISVLSKSGLSGKAVGTIQHNHIYITDMVCVPVERDAVAEKLSSHISNNLPAAFIYCSGILAGSAQECLLQQFGKSTSIFREEGGSFSVNLDSNQLDASLPKRMVKNVKRLERKAASDFDTAFEFVSGAEITHEKLEEFLVLEASGWKGEEGSNSAINTQAALINFYRHFVAEVPEQIQLSRYLVNNRLAAAHYCFRDVNRLSLAKVSYAEDLKEYSPGHVLIYNAMQKLAVADASPIISFVTNPVWLNQWKPENTLVFSAVIALSFSAKLKLGIFKLIRSLRNRFLKKD